MSRLSAAFTSMAGLALLVVLASIVYWVLDVVFDLPQEVRRVEVGQWIRDGVDFLRENLPWLFNFIRTVLREPIRWLDDLLSIPPPITVALLAAALGLWLRGWQFGLFALLGLLFITAVAMWEPAMQTLALVTVATITALLIAIPVGILAAQSPLASLLIRPVLDFMQTLPAFVYLLPALFFFGIGTVPGVVATLIFAIPPGVRLTELGIRQVDQTIVEAAHAFGATPGQIMRQVQLPLALPTIMAGVNQVIMLALSMVVIAGMIGGGGLGNEVVRGIQRYNIGLAFEAGFSVVILAIFLDRITEATGRRASRALGVA